MHDAWFERHLACPDCQRPIELAFACACGFRVPDGEPLDFRPQNPQPRAYAIPIGSTAPADLNHVLIERPPLVYDGPPAQRDSSELFSAASAWLRPNMNLLDLGCGPRDQAVPAQHIGANYVGIDYSSGAADLLADAHALPFREATFDAVLSYAVLEHLYDPFLAAREVTRVLRSGGIYFGGVSQGEPFHDSYFHHTAFGVMKVMRDAGLRVVRLWSSYDTLHALARMGRYPRVQKLLLESVHRLGRALPWLAPRKHLQWTAREKAFDELHRAASILFVAEKL